VIRMTGYQGWLGAEYLPANTTVSGLQWLDAWRSRELQPPPYKGG
jgi:hydroxypyruvate isomerase